MRCHCTEPYGLPPFISSALVYALTVCWRRDTPLLTLLNVFTLTSFNSVIYMSIDSQ